MLGMVVIFGSTKHLDYKVSFAISAIVTIVLTSQMLFTIKDVKYEKSEVSGLSIK